MRTLAVLALGLCLVLAAAGVAETPTFDPVGTWRFPDDRGKDQFVSLHMDGTAFSYRTNLENGTWSMEGKVLHLAWVDGWDHFIYREGGEYQSIGYRPGAERHGLPSFTGEAEKVTD